MTEEETLILLQEHFSEGMVRTIMDSLKQEQGEPVAYFNPQEGGFYWAKPTTVTSLVTVSVEPLPLYTTPQGCDECGKGGGYALYCLACAEKFFGKGKQWVELTDEHIINEADKFDWDKDCAVLFAKAIEAKLKDKNI